jgi:hypothetical protein
VYFYTITGDLLTTFTNPSPNSVYFGSAIAPVGDKVLIGASGGDGAAYLFSTNGSLLTTFTNPTPASLTWFGYVVAAISRDKVLITAFGDPTGAGASGVAYIFSTNGSRLTTLTNPSPARSGHFGYAAAVPGPDRLLIAATSDAGVTYLFDWGGTGAPGLKIDIVSSGLLRLSWPASSATWVLEESDVMTSSNFWSAVSPPFQTNLSGVSASLTPMGNRFYRLRRP